MAAEKFAVIFADEGMERERHLHVKKNYTLLSVSAPLQDYLASRNALVGTARDILPHRAWGTDDVGEMIYHGKRTLSDGSFVILLRYQDELLVKPVEAADAEKISRWCKVGNKLTLDKNGRHPLGASQQP